MIKTYIVETTVGTEIAVETLADALRAVKVCALDVAYATFERSYAKLKYEDAINTGISYSIKIIFGADCNKREVRLALAYGGFYHAVDVLANFVDNAEMLSKLRRNVQKIDRHTEVIANQCYDDVMAFEGYNNKLYEIVDLLISNVLF